MPLVPVTIPPGMYRNGTPYDAKNYYEDGNLIRFHNGSLRPIGGWERRAETSTFGTPIDPLVATPATETVRDGISFKDNSGQQAMVFGSNSGLYYVSSGGIITDITPAGFTGGNNDVTFPIGYGIGIYGVLTYGTPRNPGDVNPVHVQRWTFDMWGEDVICTFEDDDIYTYTPGDAQAVVLTNAPTTVKSSIVTNQRIVMTVSNTTTDVRYVEWSDQEDNDDWTPAIDNYAGFQKLAGTGDAIGMYKIQEEIAILTETDLHIGSWVAAPYVYGFKQVGVQCSPIHFKAVAATGSLLVWLGKKQFWMYDGTLRDLPCSVMDYVAADLDPVYASKIWTMTIAAYNEVWWFYQSYDADEVDSYVILNFADFTWWTGKLSRTAGIDAGTLRSPVMVDSDGKIWNHEQKSVKPVGDMYIKTGPLEIGNGDSNTAIRMLFPDTQQPNEVEYYFYTRQMPTDDDYEHGPFSQSNPVSTTGVMGREIRMKIVGLTNTWEVGGKTRLDIAAPANKSYPSR